MSTSTDLSVYHSIPQPALCLSLPECWTVQAFAVVGLGFSVYKHYAKNIRPAKPGITTGLFPQFCLTKVCIVHSQNTAMFPFNKLQTTSTPLASQEEISSMSLIQKTPVMCEEKWEQQHLHMSSHN